MRAAVLVVYGCCSGVLLGCAAAAPPQEGYQVACYKNWERECAQDQEARACSKLAPSGFYWEAMPPRKVESSSGYNCYYVLRRFNPAAGGMGGGEDVWGYPGAPAQPSAASPPAPAPGCRNDTECKGDRICENGQCVSPDVPKQTGPPCASDSDCPGNDICADGHCTAPPASAAPPGGAPPTD